MPSLDLTDDQAAILKEYLGRALSDLNVEIADTDAREYRLSLESERCLLREIVEQLSCLGEP